MEYVIVALLTVIAWAVTRPIIKEMEERKAKRLMDLLVDYYLNPKPPYDQSNYPLSESDIKWLKKIGKLPRDFGT